MAKTKQKVKMPSGIRNKLMAAVSMLVVSAIMMVSTTYAWFTLSTAPEVKNISTTVAGNGSLEIALMPETGLLGDITSGSGSSVSAAGLTASNTSWGNLITLSETGQDPYGLSKITLYPAALNLTGTDTKVLDASAPMVIPEYGADGRPAAKEANTELRYFTTENAFAKAAKTGYGVRAVAEKSETATLKDISSYGYIVDLAVRLNTAKADTTAGKLLLQTDAMQRIYSDSQNAKTLGGGSYMEFTAPADSDMSVDMVNNLMKSIRVTFIQNYGNVSDTATQTVLGTAKLDVENATVGSGNGVSRKAGLYLYQSDGTADTKLEGTNAVLLDSLTKNAAAQISAVVWLDGSSMRNADVAAEAVQSLTGTLNLQFTTDVALTPSVNTLLTEGSDTGN